MPQQVSTPSSLQITPSPPLSLSASSQQQAQALLLTCRIGASKETHNLYGCVQGKEWPNSARQSV